MRKLTKGFTLIDTDDLELKFIPANAPKFYEYEIKKDDPILMGPESVGDPNVDFIKLKYDLEWAEAVHVLEKEYPRMMTEQLPREKTVDEVDYSKIVGNDFSLLQEYIKQSGTNLDQLELLQTGMDLLVEDQ